MDAFVSFSIGFPAELVILVLLILSLSMTSASAALY